MNSAHDDALLEKAAAQQSLNLSTNTLKAAANGSNIESVPSAGTMVVSLVIPGHVSITKPVVNLTFS